MPDHDLIIPSTALEALKARTLFYPCCGRDFGLPLGIFGPYIVDFWFVDVKPDVRFPDRALPGFVVLGRERFSSSGTTIERKKPFTIETERVILRNARTGRTLRVNVCHGRGYDAFRLFFKDRQPRQPFSVFFYIGDSIGEGGNGFFWLGEERLANLLEVLEGGGLIVTDGSNSDVPQLRRFYLSRNIERAALAAAEPFEFSGKWRFECISYLGERYGPILVWRVTAI